MIRWVKGLETYTGGEFKFKIDDQEFVSYNPTDDFLEEQGWTKVETEDEKPVESVADIKRKIIQECNEFYRSSILQVMFKGQLLWVPFETRQAYRTLLEDLKNYGRQEVTFRDNTLYISEVIDILRELNLYEYDQKQVCDQHVRNIIALETEDELYCYDYTAGYSDNLSF